MGRAGYVDDYDEDNSGHLYRGRVASALRGRRGQAFLKDLLAQLDAMPEKRLFTSQLEQNGEVCTLGVMTRARKIDTSDKSRWGFSEIGEYGSDDPDQDEWVIDNLVAELDIAEPMVREIMYLNDEGSGHTETPEDRWQRMRQWVQRHIQP